MNSVSTSKANRRVLFREGKQRGLIIRAKTENSFTWEEFADVLGVSELTLRHDWRNEIYCISTEKLGLLLSLLPKSVSKNVKKDIVKIYPQNWGQIKGGQRSVEKLKRRKIIRQPSQGNDLAEFCGIMLGDGCLLKDRIYIYFNAKLDKQYLAYTSNLVKKLFGIAPIQKKHGSNCDKIAIHSIELVGFCQKIGLNVGNKTKNQVGIPEWIWE
ncbi:MAG: hypothetical protein GWP15_03310, partial [Nitrospirae bacterium]|nr:hypothetical protein [Nitrospirota bacterium]